jgi:hypothetical protein
MRARSKMCRRFGGVEPGFVGRCAMHLFNHTTVRNHASPPFAALPSDGGIKSFKNLGNGVQTKLAMPAPEKLLD